MSISSEKNAQVRLLKGKKLLGGKLITTTTTTKHTNDLFFNKLNKNKINFKT